MPKRSGQVPALRLIDDDLWDAVRRRQQSLSFAIPRDDDGNALNRAHRRKFLFSGLLKCGCCGGGFTIVGRVAVEFEQRIKSDALELQSLERKIASIVAAIEEGKYSRALGDRLADLERQRDLISARKVENPQGTIRLHPRLADVYAEKIPQLEEALNEPSIERKPQKCSDHSSIEWNCVLEPRARGSKPSSMATWSKFWDFATRMRKENSLNGCPQEVNCRWLRGEDFEPLTFRLRGR